MGENMKYLFVITIAVSVLMILYYKCRERCPSVSQEILTKSEVLPPNGAPIQRIPDGQPLDEFCDPNRPGFKWTPPILPDHLKSANQDDPELIKHIRDNWIIAPFMGERNISNIDDKTLAYGEQGQPKLISDLLGNRTNGFLVECGAADGLITSNSLWFELKYNWTGILIEANPIYFAKLLERKRHVFMLNACLSPSKTPEMLDFVVDGVAGGIADFMSPGQQEWRKSYKKPHVAVQCFPLYSILAALGVKHVDFFSLDIEGPEVAVLETIPFDLMTVDAFTIEKRVIRNKRATISKTEEIIKILSPHGFDYIHYLIMDVVLARKPKN